MVKVRVGAKRALIGSIHIEAKYYSHIILISLRLLASENLRDIPGISDSPMSMYVGGIAGLISSKKRPVPCISQPSLRHPPDENITTILLREIGCVIHCGRNR
jgi:hypothetical protein